LASLIGFATESELAEIEWLLGDVEPPPPDLADFVAATCRFSLDPWQHTLCKRLQRLCWQKGQRILIHAPPQAGKSVVISQRFPAYYLGRLPTNRVKLACYNITHATKFSRVCQELTQADYYRRTFPQAAVPPRQSRGEWSTQARMALQDGQPSFAALGLLTGFVGQGADLLLVDDPYSSPAEAASEVIREGVWTFWDEAARVRLGDDANVVVMFHRYNEDDIAGRLMATEGLRRDGGKWELMRFAAVADGQGDDPMSRPAGERLSPRMSDAYLEEQQRSGFAWEGQFQGLPGRKGGNFFEVEKLQVVDAAPAEGKSCRGWDMAATAAGGNWTAGVRIKQAARSGLWYVEHVARGQYGTAARNDAIRQTADLDGDEVHQRGEQEPGSGGKDQALMFLQLLAGLPCSVGPASGSKEVRADPFSAQVNAGNVRLVRGDWNRAYVEELRAFPRGRNDDQVDGSSTAFNWLARPQRRAGSLW
jgi:predicted phage terminase large subunit-like protein